MHIQDADVSSTYVLAGEVVTLPSTVRSHRASSPVYDDDSVDVVVEGEPLDSVFAYFSNRSGPGFVSNAFDAPLLLSGPSGRTALGTLPSNGQSAFQVPIGDLGSGVSDVRIHTQALFVDPDGPGRLILSEPSALLFLDAGLRRRTLFGSKPSLALENPDLFPWFLNPSRFGADLIKGGDLTGNGFDDVLIVSAEPGKASGVFLYEGSTNGLSRGPAWSIGERVAKGQVALADVNGDGYDDIVVNHFFPVQTAVYFGTLNGPSTTPGQVEPDLGDEVAAVGDVNGRRVRRAGDGHG